MTSGVIDAGPSSGHSLLYRDRRCIHLIEMNNLEPQAVAQRYLDTWNESDATRRLTRLDSNWAPDAAYADPMAQVQGRDELSSLIGSVQERFKGYRFALLGDPDGHGDFVRFAWSLGPDGAAPPIKGSDVVEMRDGKIARVIGFLDQLPSS